MKLPQPDRIRCSYVGLAFAVPTSLMLILYIICGYAPFGNYSLLYSDMYHQYYPFFCEFRRALRSGESLLWNWSAGMGMDYLGLISYYLASPLNLLSVLLPEQWVLGYFSLLMPIKLGLAGGFFAIMLKKLFRTDDLSLTLFGSFYAMCAWALGYQWNIMWLDTFALLPLLMLGTVQLLRDKKFVLYTITLFLSVFTSYYIGFFVCIFVLLFFFCYEICRFKSVGRFLADLCRIGFFTVLALGMTLVLELPALAALQNTQSSVNTFPEGFSVNIVSGEAVTAARKAWELYREAKEDGTRDLSLWWSAIKTSFPPLLEAMKKISGNFGGGISPTFKDGLPNLYCGVFPIALGFLFLLSRDVKIRDKLCCVILLTFFGLSFILRQLDYIWHGFHFTNQIPYRFSFLYSFVVLYMAYRAWLLRDRFRLWQILVAGALSCGLVLWSDNRTNSAYLAWNLAFLSLYLTCMVYYCIADSLQATPSEEAEADVCLPEAPCADEAAPSADIAPAQEQPEAQPPAQAEDGTDEAPTRRFRFPTPDEHRRYAAFAVAAFMALELALNLVNFSAHFPATYAGDYPRGTSSTASMIKVMQELEDDLFYRTEVTHSQTLNDGALNGYYGISTFTSSANVKVTGFMEKLGFAAYSTYNRYVYESSSPVADLFLGIKYRIDREGQVVDDSYYTVKHTYGKVTLLENDAYLPLGFLANSELGELSFVSTNSVFAFQNRLFSAATGISEDVWKDEPGSSLTVTGDENVTVNYAQNLSGYCSYGALAPGKLTYTYTMTQEGLLCLSLNMPKRNNYAVYKIEDTDGVRTETLLFSESISLPQTVSVCAVKPGDTIKVVVSCAAGEESSMTIRAAVADRAVFDRGYAVLSASTLQLTEFSTTRVSGVIRCDRDGLLYTSIPQDGNWTVYVDGEEAQATLTADVMLGVALAEGTHTIEFRYRNRAFEIGALLSFACAAVFGGVVAGSILVRRRKQKKSKS